MILIMFLNYNENVPIYSENVFYIKLKHRYVYRLF